MGARASTSTLVVPNIPELVKWKIVPHSENAFNVVAGSFEIEHFHGKTNIRILDPSHVTVEGATRGTKSKAAAPDIPVPVYQ
jgi:hypothetical protein